MSRLAAIEKSKGVKPARVLIYGIEGVGKSTFGDRAPSPVFISPEGGTEQLDSAVPLPNIKTWGDVIEGVQELITGKHDFKTLVLDSADWIEKLCHAAIIKNTGKTIITVNGGYGAGYRGAEQMHRELIAALEELREKRRMNVIVTAHYQVKTVKDPEAVHDYDAFQIKCHEFVSSLWREWCDALLFARFRTLVRKNDDDKVQAFGEGERVMYTQARPAFQAKNRYNLPFEMPVSWKDFYAGILNSKGGVADAVRGDIALLMNDNSVDAAIVPKVQQAIIDAGQDVAALTDIYNRLKQLAKK